jgi:hypothetical protein
MSTLRVNTITNLAGNPFSGFISGTTLLFYQVAAPTGWTQVTTHNDKALRVVSGTGGGSGGTTAFTSVFASRGVPLPQHSHNYRVRTNGAGGGDTAIYGLTADITDFGALTAYRTTDAQGTASASMDFAVQYIDVILCSKN